MCTAVEDVHHAIYDYEPNKSCHEKIKSSNIMRFKIRAIGSSSEEKHRRWFRKLCLYRELLPRVQKILNKKF